MPAERSSRPVTGLIMIAAAAMVFAASATELFAIYRASQGGEDFGETLAGASRLSPLNWSYDYKRASTLLRLGRYEEAVAGYRSALARNPTCAMCALGLAEVAFVTGDDPEPYLRDAVEHGRSSTAVRMRAGIAYARMGRDDDAAEEFHAALLGTKNDPWDLFAMFERLYPVEFVLDRIVPDDLLVRYFGYACRHLEPDDVRTVWARFQVENNTDAVREKYVNYLVRHGLVHEAWQTQFGDAVPVGTMLDGGFEKIADHGPFGWHFNDVEGARTDVRRCDDCGGSDYALRVKFDGKHNMSYRGVNQYVAVVPGAAYRIKARVHADSITSAQAPFLAVDGLSGSDVLGCDLWAQTEQIDDTAEWVDATLDFVVPKNCEGVRISVMRPRTKRLDQFIEGELWVDDVALELVTLTPPEPAPEGTTAGELTGTIARIFDMVHGGGDGLPGEDHLRAGGDEGLGSSADQSDGALQSLGETGRSFFDGMGVTRHGMELASPEQALRAFLRSASPDSEQRVPIELKDGSGLDPFGAESGTVLKNLVPLGMGEDRGQAAGPQSEDRLGDRGRDDGDGHLEEDGRSAAE